MVLLLTGKPFLVHEANVIAQTHAMEYDQVLPAQAVDCEKHLVPREVWLPDGQDLVHGHHFVSVKHVQDGLLCIRMFRDHRLFLSML
jgi:hypothetical protein